MKRLLLALLLIFGITAPVAAQFVTGVETQERIVKLPEDAGNWYVSLFGLPQDGKFQELQVWFDTDPALRQMKSRVHFHPIPTNTQMFSRYAPYTPTTPCIRVQDSRGIRVYEASGNQIPMSPHALTNAINTAIFRRCPDGNCNPAPAPVDPAPVPAPIDTPPVTPEPQSDLSMLWLILSALGGAGGGTAQWWKSQYFDQA